jgi:hypothetical protein
MDTVSWFENRKGRYHLEDIGVNWKIILYRIIWFRIGTSGELL